MKKVNYKYTVDLTDSIDGCDVFNVFAEAKIKAGLPINVTEYNACMVNAINATIEITDLMTSFIKDITESVIKPVDTKESTKKPNIFRRFWNWMTNKK